MTCETMIDDGAKAWLAFSIREAIKLRDLAPTPTRSLRMQKV